MVGELNPVAEITPDDTVILCVPPSKSIKAEATTEVGFTHIPTDLMLEIVVIVEETVSLEEDPWKYRHLPLVQLSSVCQVGIVFPARVAVTLLPEESEAVVPVPSSNFQYTKGAGPACSEAEDKVSLAAVLESE